MADTLIQLMASLGTVASIYCYGNKWKLGPVLGIAAEVPWLLIMIHGSLWGLLPVNTVVFAMHIRNLWKWNNN